MSITNNTTKNKKKKATKVAMERLVDEYKEARKRQKPTSTRPSGYMSGIKKSLDIIYKAHIEEMLCDDED